MSLIPRWTMPKAREGEIMLGLLEAVEADGGHSQRHLASELGIALGLVNIYIKRCVKKGLIKVTHAPTRRYAYYLTPQGFAEKSRLTAEYLSRSLRLFRRARSACVATLADAAALGWRRIALSGEGDLAEVFAMCAAGKIEIVQIAAPHARDDAISGHGEGQTQGSGCRVVASLGEAANLADGLVIADLHSGADHYALAVAAFGAGRVLVLNLVSFPVATAAASRAPADQSEDRHE